MQPAPYRRMPESSTWNRGAPAGFRGQTRRQLPAVVALAGSCVAGFRAHHVRAPCQRRCNCRLARRRDKLSRAEQSPAELEEVEFRCSAARALGLPNAWQLIGSLLAAFALDTASGGAGYFSRTWGRCRPAGFCRTSSQGRGPVPRGAEQFERLVTAGEPRRCDRHSPTQRPLRATPDTSGHRFTHRLMSALHRDAARRRASASKRFAPSEATESAPRFHRPPALSCAAGATMRRAEGRHAAASLGREVSPGVARNATRS